MCLLLTCYFFQTNCALGVVNVRRSILLNFINTDGLCSFFPVFFQQGYTPLNISVLGFNYCIY